MNVRLIIMLATALGLAFFAVSIAKTLMQDKIGDSKNGTRGGGCC